MQDNKNEQHFTLFIIGQIRVSFLVNQGDTN